MDIIVRRVEGSPKDRHGTSMHKIGEDQNKSPQTIHRHIKAHNKEIGLRGYCIRCRRVKNRYDKVEA